MKEKVNFSLEVYWGQQNTGVLSQVSTTLSPGECGEVYKEGTNSSVSPNGSWVQNLMCDEF